MNASTCPQLLEASKMVEAEQQRKQAVCSFTYHMGLNQLWIRPMSSWGAVQLPPEVAWEKDSLIKRLRKAMKEVSPMEKPQVVKIHLRNMIIRNGRLDGGMYDSKTFKPGEIKLIMSSPSPACPWSTAGLAPGPPIPPAPPPPRSHGTKTHV